MSFLHGTEEYYQRFIELQDKLRKSEEARLKLEIKFNEMVQVTREEEQLHYRKLRSQYQRFLEEDHLRQERNEKILRILERIETRAVMLAAKTERFELLRKQYLAYLKRMLTNAKHQTAEDNAKIPDIASTMPTITEQKSAADHQSNLYNHPTIRKALFGDKDARANPKVDIVKQYLNSLSTPASGDNILKATRSSDYAPKTEIAQFSDNSGSSRSYSDELSFPRYKSSASNIADEIINSIYSKSRVQHPYQMQADNNYKQYKDDFNNGLSDTNRRYCGTKLYGEVKTSGKLQDVEMLANYPYTSELRDKKQDNLYGENHQPYSQSTVPGNTITETSYELRPRVKENKQFKNDSLDQVPRQVSFSDKSNINGTSFDKYNLDYKNKNDYDEQVYNLSPNRRKEDVRLPAQANDQLSTNYLTTIKKTEQQVYPPSVDGKISKFKNPQNNNEDEQYVNSANESRKKLEKDHNYKDKDNISIDKTMENRHNYDKGYSTEMHANEGEPSSKEQSYVNNVNNNRKQVQDDEYNEMYNLNKGALHENQNEMQEMNVQNKEHQYKQKDEYQKRDPPQQQVEGEQLGQYKEMHGYNVTEHVKADEDEQNTSYKPNIACSEYKVPAKFERSDSYDDQNKDTALPNEEVEQYYDNEHYSEYNPNVQQPGEVHQTENNNIQNEQEQFVDYRSDVAHGQLEKPIQYNNVNSAHYKENAGSVQYSEHEQSINDTENSGSLHYDEREKPVTFNECADTPQYHEDRQPTNHKQNAGSLQYEAKGQPINNSENVDEPQYNENKQPTNYNENEVSPQYSQPTNYNEYTDGQQYNENEYNEYEGSVQYDENGQSGNYSEKTVPLQYDEHGQPVNYNAHIGDQQYDENEQPVNYNQNSGSIQYDENGQPINYNENMEQPQYDEQPVSYDNQEHVQYNQQGQPVQYNEQGEPINYVHKQPIQYNENGEPILYEEQGNPTQYDENGQPIYADDGQYYSQYDANGQPIQQFDENGQPVFQYDEHGQPIQQFNENRQPEVQYDENGQPIYQYDPNQQYYPDEMKGGEYQYENYQPNQTAEHEQSMKQQYEIAETVPESQLKSDSVHQQNGRQNTEEDKQETKSPQRNSEKQMNVLDMLDTDTESAKQETKVSNDSDFDFSNG